VVTPALLNPEHHDAGPWPFEPPTGIPVPDALVMPADDGTPHPLAAAAIEGLVASLAERPPLGLDFAAPGCGKMFGVLVVAPRSGGLATLRGFSGMLDRTWFVDRYVPPLFDAHALAAFWPDGEAELVAMSTAIAAAQGETRRVLARSRRARSQALWRRVVATYRITDVHGHVRPMADLFAPRLPPAGAGDCAAPKLLAHALAAGLRPLALGEVWWGAPVGRRRSGTTWPPCTDKCGPILGHMLARTPRAQQPPRG
jgi:tRNA pseudouridine32 synthase/23S rRNA pseudouridine746 synthase